MATNQEYYQALLEKNSDYEGLFYVGVKTTGVFCRPTCPARMPKFENCEFFETVQQSLLAGYRPCKRCRPLSHPNHVPEFIRTLVEAVEAQPEKRWRSADLRAMYVDPSTARRQFKKHFGMTFIEYARARRLGLAMKQIKGGASVIDAQVTAGYEFGSGFRDAFARFMGAAPSKARHSQVLEAAWIETKLGPMIAIGDDVRLFLLEFVDRRGLEREIERLRRRLNAAIIPGRTAPLEQIETEIQQYFACELRDFKTPLAFVGSDFQKRVLGGTAASALWRNLFLFRIGCPDRPAVGSAGCCPGERRQPAVDYRALPSHPGYPW